MKKEGDVQRGPGWGGAKALELHPSACRSHTYPTIPAAHRSWPSWAHDPSDICSCQVPPLAWPVPALTALLSTSPGSLLGGFGLPASTGAAAAAASRLRSGHPLLAAPLSAALFPNPAIDTGRRGGAHFPTFPSGPRLSFSELALWGARLAVHSRLPTLPGEGASLGTCLQAWGSWMGGLSL